MSLDHQALAATVLGMVAIVVLGLAVLGAGVAVRAALHFADDLRAERAWRRSTRTVPLLPADEDGWTALADAVHEAPQPQLQPDLRDDRRGTDDDLLQQVRDIWPNSPRGDQ